MLLTWLLAAVSLGGGTGATDAPPAPPPVQASAAAFGDTVVVTASIRPESTASSPATVDVVDADEIEARQAETVGQVLATLPGVALAESGTPGHVTSLFMRGTNSNQTLVLWNGIPLNDPILGGFDWSFLPTEGVERVEVVRGPYSALYGSNAIGGVVNVVTARRHPGGQVAVEAGSGPLYQLRGAGSDDLGPVHLEATGHWRHGDGDLPNDFFNSSDGSVRLAWAPATSTDVGLLARANDSAVGVPQNAGEPTPRQQDHWLERQAALPFSTFADTWQIDALFSLDSAALHFRNPDDPFFTFSDSHSQALRARASASDALDATSWLAGGAEWSNERATENDSTGVELDRTHRNDGAVFAQGHTLLFGVTLEAGLREDDDQRFGHRLSPNLGLAFALTPGLRLHASYGEGFRAPALGELFFPFFGNQALKPEISQAEEIGVTAAFGSWRFDAEAFENRLRDLIEFDLLSGIDFNIGRARTRGVEASGGFRHGRLELRANGTYLDAKDLDTGEALLRRPRLSANAMAFWRPDRWTLSAVERYVGHRLDFDPVTFLPRTNPAYATLDLGTAYAWSPLLSPYVRLENVFGRRYEEVLGYPALGRTIVGGVNFHF